MARLTAPDGTVVSVDDGKVAGLVARGYAKQAPAETKTEKPPSPKSGKSGKSSK